MSEHRSFTDNPFLPPGEPIVGQTYRADGWQYANLPTMTLTMRDELLDIIGVGNYIVLIQTIKTIGAGSWRGTILISPEGQINLKERAKADNDQAN